MGFNSFPRMSYYIFFNKFYKQISVSNQISNLLTVINVPRLLAVATLARCTKLYLNDIA